MTVGAANSSSNITVDPAKAAVIEGNQIDFSVVRTADSKANTLQCNIYNLSPDTLSLMEKQDAFVKLDAGYVQGEIGTIFRGNKIHMTTSKQGPHKVTTLQAAEGYVQIRESKLALTLPKGSTLRQILLKIASEVSSDLSTELSGEILNKTFNAGSSVIGNMKQNLDAICKAHGLEWSIQNNKTLIVNPIGKPNNNLAQAVVVSYDTGLIGAPERTSQNVSNLEKAISEPEIQGVRFTSLLDHRYFVGGWVKLQGTNLDGTYKIIEVTHNGNYEGNQWTSTVEASVPK